MNQQQSRFAGETILIVDDEEVIVELAALLLKKRGFNVLTASNGQQGLDAVSAHRPAVVLLDYMMPVMNGLDALRLIRQNFPDTYVVMFTGKGSEEVAVELMKSGAADYLQKPFAKHSLQERIDAVLARRYIEIENRNLLEEREALQQEIEQWNFELEQRVRQKSFELEQAHKEIVQAEKLAALGHISAGMAHEIRNPLNSISLYAQLLQADADLSVEQCEYIDKIAEEVERIDTILRKMLASSEAGGAKRERVFPAAIARKVISDYEPRMMTQQVRLQLEIAEGLPAIEVDPNELEQIFVNLISNALFEMADGGLLRISLCAGAENVILEIADSGPGIPAENISRIFDPFFTTKDKGTGFGLSVVLRVVKGCGGRILVTNCNEGGACFRIEFPLFPQSVH